MGREKLQLKAQAVFEIQLVVDSWRRSLIAGEVEVHLTL
jgi:hypothetical protein